MSLIHLHIDGHLAEIVLQRPKALNALNLAMLAELDAALEKLEAATDLRCLLLHTAGDKAFVAGADIAEMAQMGPAEAQSFSQLGNRIFARLARFPAPVIAALKGYALGGGFELALAADIRVGSPSLRLAFPETSLGITPGFGGTQRLARLIGPNRAAEWIFTGRHIKAEEALQLGLISALHPEDELLAAARSLAHKLCSRSPIALRQAKTAIYDGIALPLDEALALEAELFAECFNSNDQKRAMAAFLAKEAFDDFKNA